jgi:hypothetical protein
LAIVLLVVFYILEFLGIIGFIEWILLVAVIFLLANVAIRQVRKRG